jgi:hypothetical protein
MSKIQRLQLNNSALITRKETDDRISSLREQIKKEQVNEVPMNISIRDSLRTKFKAKCASDNRSIKDVVSSLIENYVNES